MVLINSFLSFFAPPFPSSLWLWFGHAAPHAYCRRCFLRSLLFPSAVHPFRSTEGFFTTVMAQLPLAIRPVSYLVGSDGTTSLSASVGQQSQPPPQMSPHISPLSRDRSPKVRGAPNGPLKTFSRAVVLSSDVPLPSCLD